MPRFEVEVTEHLRRTVYVEATSSAEARRLARSLDRMADRGDVQVAGSRVTVHSVRLESEADDA